MLLEGPLQGPDDAGWPQSRADRRRRDLPRLVTGLRAALGLAASALVAAVVVWLVLISARRLRLRDPRRRRERRAPRALPACRSTRVLLRVGACSPARLAGLAGAGEVAGLKGYLTLDLSPGFGYAGIVVAMLAGLNPLGVVAGRDLRRRRLRRRRHDEPRPSACRATSPTSWWRSSLLTRAGGRARHAATASASAGSEAWLMAALDILGQASFWAAVMRIATPLIFGHPRRAAVRARRRAQPRHRGDHVVAGAMVGWLAVYARRAAVAGRGVAALTGAWLRAAARRSSPWCSACRQHVSGIGRHAARHRRLLFRYRVTFAQRRARRRASSRSGPSPGPLRHSLPRRRAGQQTAAHLPRLLPWCRGRLPPLPHAARPRDPHGRREPARRSMPRACR